MSWRQTITRKEAVACMLTMLDVIRFYRLLSLEQTETIRNLRGEIEWLRAGSEFAGTDRPKTYRNKPVSNPPRSKDTIEQPTP